MLVIYLQGKQGSPRKAIIGEHPLVPVWGTSFSFSLLIGEHPLEDDIDFGEVGYRNAMILVWTVYDLVEVVLVALLLLVTICFGPHACDPFLPGKRSASLGGIVAI